MTNFNLELKNAPSEICKKNQSLLVRIKIHYQRCKNNIPESSNEIEVVGKLLMLLFIKPTKNLTTFILGFGDRKLRRAHIGKLTYIQKWTTAGLIFNFYMYT